MMQVLSVQHDCQFLGRSSVVLMEYTGHSFVALSLMRQRRHYCSMRAMSAVTVHSSSANVSAWVARQTDEFSAFTNRKVVCIEIEQDWS